MNLVLKGASFNGLYLKALTAAVSGAFPYEMSRVGKVINIGQAYWEVATNDPRLIFLNSRKMNPVFAIIEAAWILFGHNDLVTLSAEISHFGDYSDDKVTLNGAYGYRLRSFFQKDQIKSAIDELRTNSKSRRVVLTIYSPDDLGKTSHDIPCNTTAYLKIRSGALDITVLNRSNDLYMGVPYNVFVFGVLQRHISLALGVPIGVQRHFTDGLHVYEEDIPKALQIIKSNNQSAVDAVSRRFGWGFADEVIESHQEIALGKYDDIKCFNLRQFLSQYCAEGRAELRRSNGTFTYINNFFGFLAHQWVGPTGNEESQAWEELRRSMIMPDIKQHFITLADSPGSEIATQVQDIASRLTGKFEYLRDIINEQSGPLGVRDFGGNEDLALKTLLLSLVLSANDPYLAGTFIGEHAKQELAAACSKLDVPLSMVGPLSTVEHRLLDALGELLQ